MPFPFTILFEVLCLVVAAFCLKNENGWWKWFIYYLLIIIFCEVLATMLVVVFKQKNNHWVYNFFVLPTQVAFFLFAYTKIQAKKVNYFAKWVGLIFFIIYLSENYLNHFSAFSTNTNTIFSILVISLTCKYFHQLLQSVEIENLLHHPPFWIMAGFFFFYFGGFVCNAFFDYLVSDHIKNNRHLRYYIFIVINFIFYSCWYYAFLCRKKEMISHKLL